MRVASPALAFNHHPFAAGARGASLYVGVGPNDGSDPGPSSVKFRKHIILGRRWVRGSSFHFGDGVRKCCTIAQTTDPTAELQYDPNGAWDGRVVYIQVRTWWDHCELVHNINPVRLDVANTGDIDPQLYGTGQIISTEKRDGGIYRIRATYNPSISGIQPLVVLLRQTAGPGSLADVELDYDADQRIYEFDTEALTDSQSYTFTFIAQNDTVELTVDDVTFTADAAGPPEATGVTISLT